MSGGLPQQEWLSKRKGHLWRCRAPLRSPPYPTLSLTRRRSCWIPVRMLSELLERPSLNHGQVHSKSKGEKRVCDIPAEQFHMSTAGFLCVISALRSKSVTLVGVVQTPQIHHSHQWPHCSPPGHRHLQMCHVLLERLVLPPRRVLVCVALAMKA